MQWEVVLLDEQRGAMYLSEGLGLGLGHPFYALSNARWLPRVSTAAES